MKNIKLLSIMLAVFTSLSLFPALSFSEDFMISVIVDENPVTFPDAKPFINPDNSRTMVPIRFIAENLKAVVEWEVEGEEVVTITKEDTKINLKIGSEVALVNGEEKVFDASAILKDGRTFVPLRLISESLNCEVFWVEKEKQIEIFYNKISCGDVVINKDDYKKISIGSDFMYRKDNSSAICTAFITYLLGDVDLRISETEKLLVNFVDENMAKEITDFIRTKEENSVEIGETIFEGDLYKIGVINNQSSVLVAIYKKI